MLSMILLASGAGLIGLMLVSVVAYSVADDWRRGDRATAVVTALFAAGLGMLFAACITGMLGG